MWSVNELPLNEENRANDDRYSGAPEVPEALRGCVVITDPRQLTTYIPELERVFQIAVEVDGEWYKIEMLGDTPQSLHDLQSAFESIYNHSENAREMTKKRFRGNIIPETYWQKINKEFRDPDITKFVVRNSDNQIISITDVSYGPVYKRINPSNKKGNSKIVTLTPRIAEVSYLTHPDYTKKGLGKMSTLAAMNAVCYLMAHKYDGVYIAVTVQGNIPSNSLAQSVQEYFESAGAKIWTETYGEDLSERENKYVVRFDNLRSQEGLSPMYNASMRELFRREFSIALNTHIRNLDEWSKLFFKQMDIAQATMSSINEKVMPAANSNSNQELPQAA